MIVSQQQKPQTLHTHPCNRCRAHKKKCDRLPICSNCSKREVICEYKVDESRKPYHNNLTQKFKKLATTVNNLIDKIEIEARVPRGKRYSPYSSTLGKLQDLETYQIPLLYYQLVKINENGVIYNQVGNSTTENLLNMFFWYLHPISTFINKEKIFNLIQSKENGSNPLLVSILMRSQIFFMNYFSPEQPLMREDLYLYKLTLHLINQNTNNSSLELIQACLLLAELEASFCSPKAEYYLNIAVKMSHVENLHSIENYTDNQVSQEDKVYNYMTYLMLVTMEERLFYQVKRTGLSSISNKYNLLHVSNCSRLERPIDLMICSQVISHFIFYLGDIQSRVNNQTKSVRGGSKLKFITAKDSEKILKTIVFALNFPLKVFLEDIEDYFKNGFSTPTNSRIVIFITLAIMIRFLIDLKPFLESRHFNYDKNPENEHILNEINLKLPELANLDYTMCCSIVKFANTDSNLISNRYGLHPIELSDYRVCYIYFYTLKRLIDSGASKENPQLLKLVQKIKLTCRLWELSSPLYNLIPNITKVPPSVSVYDFDSIEKYIKAE